MNIRLFLTLLAGLVPSLTSAALPNNVTFVSFISGTTSAPLNKPVYFAEVPGKPGYYVVLEQHVGRISVFNKPTGATEWTKTIMDTVTIPSGVSGNNEMGLLGMAFHPNFILNHKYYLYYNPSYSSSAGARAHLVERQTDTSSIKRNSTVASRVILNIASPYPNHKGGTIEFGPTDGYLYLGIGDGGGTAAYRYGNDSGSRAQNPDSLLGKFLRIDVDNPTGGKEYGIPADNPYAASGGAKEVYAIGARNPFKWSFDVDPGTGKANVWLGHVGQDSIESATLVPKGSNLGWKVVEGPLCNAFYGTTCNKTGFQAPFLSYRHVGSGDSIGKSITGGFVYRKNPASPFYGAYFFGDLSTFRVWAVRTDGITTQEKVSLGIMPTTGGTTEQLVSFGKDLAGNLYVVARGSNTTAGTNGVIYSITSPDFNTVAIAPRPRARGFAPLSSADAAGDLRGLKLRDLQGRGVSGSLPGGLYLTRRPGETLPALVPVLK